MPKVSANRFACLGLLLGLAVAPAVADGPFQFYTVTPCRVIDTRVGFGGILTGQTARDFQVQGICGIPVGTQAVSLVVTAFQATSDGSLTLYPSGTARPLTGTMFFKAGPFPTTQSAIVALSTNRDDLTVFPFLTTTSQTMHMVLDVTGYFK